MDTIFALASAQGKAGVSVIRISGPRSHDVASALVGPLPAPQSSGVRTVRDENGDTIDEVLTLRFDGPRSFTGEDVVEIQCHGSTAIVRAILSTLGKLEGARIADPGEFTRRALENGKMDLTQVEGLADLIDAETEIQRQQAQRIFSGALGNEVSVWRKDLIRAAALIEATIDFADEDVPADVTPEVLELLSKTEEALRHQLDGLKIAERIRIGFEVAIVGPPNVGKSTLLNFLAGRDAAITSEIAGTTRDVIEVRMDLGGLPVTLLDTAGLRETEDHVEGIGVARAIERAKAADLRVFLTENKDTVLDPLPGDIVVRAKADQHRSAEGAVSGLTGQGVSQLVTTISQTLSDRSLSAGLGTRERHRAAMEKASDSMEKAQMMLKRGPAFYDISAEEIRSGIRALESLVGHVDVENLLDEIFASFCLGK